VGGGGGAKEDVLLHNQRSAWQLNSAARDDAIKSMDVGMGEAW